LWLDQNLCTPSRRYLRTNCGRSTRVDQNRRLRG
jgi:hypothetical protein